MLIGVISDTHEDVEGAKAAIAIFRSEKVEMLLHLGDYISPPMVRLFKGFRLIGVYGNNDGFRDGVASAFSEIGGEIKGDFAELELDGLKAALYHGTYEAITEALAKSSTYDVVFTGHNHTLGARSVGRTLLLNPGTAHKGFQGDTKPSIGVFDTKTREFRIIGIYEYGKRGTE